MGNNMPTVDILAAVFCQAAKITLDKCTRQSIKFSKTLQGVPKVSLRPEMGSFVQFSGDYNGLVVMNFSAGAALDIYKTYMLAMGIAESELAKEHTSNEVVDTMGEITNQIMGRAVRLVETKYDLSAFFGQPKALALNSAITLTPDCDYRENRRISFSIGTNRFHMELAMEKTDFIPMEEV